MSSFLSVSYWEWKGKKELFVSREDPGWEVTLPEFSSQLYQLYPLMTLGRSLGLFASPCLSVQQGGWCFCSCVATSCSSSTGSSISCSSARSEFVPSYGVAAESQADMTCRSVMAGLVGPWRGCTFPRQLVCGCSFRPRGPGRRHQVP